jgi:hypothetical protein
MLRDAFMATMMDPEFLARAERLKLERDPSPGDQGEAMVTRLYLHPPEFVAPATAALE